MGAGQKYWPCFGFWPQKSKTKTSSLEEIAETMVTSLQPSLLPTKEQIRSLGIDDNELLLRTLREGLNQSETANLTSIDTTKTSIPSTNHSEEPQVEEITIPNSFELFMWSNLLRHSNDLLLYFWISIVDIELIMIDDFNPILCILQILHGRKRFSLSTFS